AGGHSLHVSRSNHRTVAHAVFVFECAFEDVGDDLHVAMSMRRKTTTSRDKIFIDHTQAAKAHVPRIVILIESERVIRIQPPMIEMTTLLRFPDRDHSNPSS